MADVIIIRPISRRPSDPRHRGQIRLPHGLLHLGASLIKKGFSVKLIDDIAEENSECLLINELKKNPICVGISSLTGIQIKNGLKFAGVVRENSSIPIVWGGTHPTVMPIKTTEDPLVDITVYGEGDETFPELVDTLKRNGSLKDIEGICYKKDGRMILNSPRHITNLDEVPLLPYHLIDMEKYLVLPKRKINRYFEVISSKGCPFRCRFCQNPTYSHIWRYKSIPKIIDEVKYLVENYKIDGITFLDDDFCVSRKRVVNLCKEIIKEKFNIIIRTSARVDQLAKFDDNTWSALKEAGFDHFGIGIESGSQRLLDYIQKDITIKQIHLANEKLKKYGFAMTYNFMVGFPTESYLDYLKTLELIRYLFWSNRKIIYPINTFNLYTPYPGTSLYDEIARKGFRLPETFRDWANIDFRHNDLPWIKPELKEFIPKFEGIINDLNKKFIGEEAGITKSDFTPLDDLKNLLELKAGKVK